MGKLVIIREVPITPEADASYASFKAAQSQLLGESCGLHPMQKRAALVDKADLERGQQMSNEQLLESIANMNIRVMEWTQVALQSVMDGTPIPAPGDMFPEQDEQSWKA